MFFVEPGDGTGVVADRLADWYRRNAADVAVSPDALPERLRALLAAIADAGAKPEEAPGYWECFASLAALGWTDAAVDLAALHSCWEEWRVGKASARPMAELLEAAVALVRTAPRLGRADSDADADADAALGDDDDGQTRAANPPATSVPQFLAFREAWTRQIREVLADAALFDGCGDVAAAEGVRAALSAMAGDETAVSRAAPGGWLELMVAEARCRYPLARAAAARRHRATMRRRARIRRERGDGSTVARRRGRGRRRRRRRVRAHLDAWFLAHLAEMLVAAAGEGHRVGRADPTAGALRREGVALAGGGFRPGSGAAVTARDAPAGAVRPPTDGDAQGWKPSGTVPRGILRGARDAAGDARSGAEVRRARGDARGELAAATLRGVGAAPGRFPRRRRRANGIRTARSRRRSRFWRRVARWVCPRRRWGCARGGVGRAREGGDATGAAAWLHRAGISGGRGGGGGTTPDAGDGRDGPGRGGGDARTTRRGTPGERGRERGVGMGRIRGVCGVGTRPVYPPRRRCARRTGTPRRPGANAATTARAAAEVASPATAATARRAGAIVAALLSHGAGQKHLWADRCFAPPLLEGAPRWNRRRYSCASRDWNRSRRRR